MVAYKNGLGNQDVIIRQNKYRVPTRQVASSWF